MHSPCSGRHGTVRKSDLEAIFYYICYVMELLLVVMSLQLWYIQCKIFRGIFLYLYKNKRPFCSLEGA